MNASEIGGGSSSGFMIVDRSSMFLAPLCPNTAHLTTAELTESNQKASPSSANERRILQESIEQDQLRYTSIKEVRMLVMQLDEPECVADIQPDDFRNPFGKRATSKIYFQDNGNSHNKVPPPALINFGRLRAVAESRPTTAKGCDCQLTTAERVAMTVIGYTDVQLRTLAAARAAEAVMEGEVKAWLASDDDEPPLPPVKTSKKDECAASTQIKIN